MFIKLLLYSFVVVFLSGEVNSQVCIKQTYITQKVPRTYQDVHFVTHSERCNSSVGWCFHSKWETNLKTRYEKVEILKSIKYCCDGYIRDYNDSGNDGNITCKPICKPACVNGYCKDPGNCECNAGYTLYKQNNYTCIPFCEKGCGNGTCIAPNTCQCDLGYEPKNGTCQPVCTIPCLNGTCVSPDTCECLPGYRMSFITDHCEPYCSKGCYSGRCISPEKCFCYTGSVLEENTHPNRCVIKCSLIYPYNMCGKGTCEASNLCRCFPGYYPDYIKRRSYLDVPICQPMPTCTDCKGGAGCVPSPKCVNQTISGNKTRTTSHMSTKTETSTTYTTSTTSLPSEMKADDKTLLKCNLNPCGNGTCVFSNQCRCFSGYCVNYMRLWGYAKGSVCVPACTDCYGSSCVAPNKCMGQEISTTTNIITNSRGMCDVFHNCNKTISRNITRTKSGMSTTTISSTSSETSPRYKTTKSLSLPSEMMANEKTFRNCNIKSCGKEVFTTINEETTRTTSETRTTTETSTATKLRTAYKTGTTSVSPPSITTDTYKHYERENETTTEYYFVTNNGSIREVTEELMQMSWIQQHTMSILIPIIVVVTAGVIVLLVWRRTRILNLFQRKSYAIQGNPSNNNGSHTFQKIQFYSQGNQESAVITL